jgi:hypothetical protein
MSDDVFVKMPRGRWGAYVRAVADGEVGGQGGTAWRTEVGAAACVAAMGEAVPVDAIEFATVLPLLRAVYAWWPPEHGGDPEDPAWLALAALSLTPAQRAAVEGES